jgi:hypothetical protein
MDGEEEAGVVTTFSPLGARTTGILAAPGLRTSRLAALVELAIPPKSLIAMGAAAVCSRSAWLIAESLLLSSLSEELLLILLLLLAPAHR